jgi:hypothetical protein
MSNEDTLTTWEISRTKLSARNKGQKEMILKKYIVALKNLIVFFLLI